MRIFLLALLILIAGCENQEKKLTPEMEKNARKNVEKRIKHQGLPSGELIASSKHFAYHKPDFTYFYVEDGRCIQYIVNCYAGTKCSEVSSYPHHEHGEKCPIKNKTN